MQCRSPVWRSVGSLMWLIVDDRLVLLLALAEADISEIVTRPFEEMRLAG